MTIFIIQFIIIKSFSQLFLIKINKKNLKMLNFINFFTSKFERLNFQRRVCYKHYVYQCLTKKSLRFQEPLAIKSSSHLVKLFNSETITSDNGRLFQKVADPLRRRLIASDNVADTSDSLLSSS